MIKVIYIAGQSFSGSTLLCAVLGIQPQLEPVSELAKWTTGYFRKPDRLCACGRKIVECEFWSAVEEKWLLANSLDRYIGLQNEFEHISSIWRNRLSQSPRPPAEFSLFQDSTVALYQSIISAGGRSVIVDSSKLPGRALALARMAELDVSIIHLVRNGLQFLKSALTRGKLIAKDDPKILYRAFLLGLNWSITNIASEYVLRTSKCKVLRVRYEDFILDPIQTVKVIGAVTDTDTRQIQDHISRGGVISYRHMTGGSLHRFKEPKPITKEFSAVPEIDGRLKTAFEIGAGLLFKRYGY